MKPESIRVVKTELNPPFCPYKSRLYVLTVKNKSKKEQRINIKEIFFIDALNKTRPALCKDSAVCFSDGTSFYIKAGLENNILNFEKLSISPGGYALIFYRLKI